MHMKEIYTIIFSSAYEEWFFNQPEKYKAHIAGKLDNIKYKDHFGDHKLIDSTNNLWKLRWRNGRRMYFVYLSKQEILLLLGGNKNGQSQNIKKAKNILKTWYSSSR